MSKEEPLDWEALVPLFIHTTKIWIIEAFSWIDQPLSASEFEKIFNRRQGVSAISYHIKTLAELGILRLVETRQVRGAWQSFYVLRPKAKLRKKR